MRQLILLTIIVSVVSGCATITGPSVSREEILKEQQRLTVKSLEFRLRQLAKINNIGYQLIANIPQDEVKARNSAEPYLGIYVSEIDKYLKQLYQLKSDNGLVVVVVLDGSPAESAGINPGDVLLSLNNRKFSSLRDFLNYSAKLVMGDNVRLQIKRDALLLDKIVKVGSIPINVPFVAVDAQEVNAAASSNAIYVTYGLINFVKSDDELAAVLGHELAHLVRGHLTRAQVSSLVSLLIALPLGMIAEEAAPGTGDLVLRTTDVFRAGYSRDLEREADYFGAKFVYFAGYDPCVCANFQERFAIEIPQSMVRNYFSTHPSSPERALRIKKSIEEFARVSCP